MGGGRKEEICTEEMESAAFTEKKGGSQRGVLNKGAA
jgi:hypothetical protein